jgi:hypothetical protein
MRYSDFAKLSETVDVQLQDAWKVQARRRLKELNRERLELIAVVVQRELRRYLPGAEFERYQIDRRLDW